MEFTITCQDESKEFQVATGTTIQTLLECACSEFKGCNSSDYRLELDGNVYPKTTVLSENHKDIALVRTKEARDLLKIMYRYANLCQPSAKDMRKIGDDIDSCVLKLPVTSGLFNLGQRLSRFIHLHVKSHEAQENKSDIGLSPAVFAAFKATMLDYSNLMDLLESYAGFM
jgi:hypothetical protein